MSGGIILPGGGTSGGASGDDKQDEADGRRVNVTNFLSFGHMIPWGGVLDIKRMSPQEVQAFFKDKRVDLFVCPDLELITDMVQHEVMATGHMPQGTIEERHENFCSMVEHAVKQMTNCHVRRIQQPKPGSGRRQFYIQFYPQPSTVVGSQMSLGNIWWEIVTKELRQKPQPVATAKESS